MNGSSEKKIHLGTRSKYLNLIFMDKRGCVWRALLINHHSDYVWKRSAALVSGQQGENMSCYLNKILEILVGGY